MKVLSEKTRRIRVLAALLAVMMVTGLFSMLSCADDTSTAEPSQDDVTDEPGSTPSEEIPEEEENVPDTDDLPADLNYGEAEFRICTRLRDFFHANWITDDFDGSYINDAIYSRQCAVEERLGVVFTEMLVQSTEDAKVAVVAGSDDFDIINARCSDAWSYAQQDLVLAVDALTYLDPTKSYWDPNLNAALTVGGISYFAVGASNLSAYDFTHALLFNKQMISDYELTMPYRLVDDGTWTIEAFATMIEDVSLQVDGSDDESVYGYLSQPKAVLPGFWIGADILSIEKNADDIPEFTLPGNQKFFDLFELMYEITYDSDAWYVNQSRVNSDPVLLNMFQSDRGLFYATSFFYIENMRTMEADFGIVPYPKYDETQKEYLARIEGSELTCVPITVPSAERVSAVLEALASVSATTVVPTYYEIVLKGVTSRDNESSEMLDIIFANRVFDLGDTIWCDVLRDGVFETMFMYNDRNLASKMESVTPVLDDLIAEAVAAFAGEE